MKKLLLCLIPTLLFLCLLASCTPTWVTDAWLESSGGSSAEAVSSAEPWESSEEASSAPEESRPEETEPEVSEPEVSEPEVSEPEVSEPEVSEPEVSEPEDSEPEVSEPEASEPEVSEPEVSEPEVSEPEVSEPEISEPEVSEPEEIYVEKIIVSASKGELTVGETMTLDVKVSPDDADEKAVTWSIESGSKYASISASGVLTAVAPGEVVVKATAKDGSGVSATYTVTVKPILVSSITISGNTTVEEGKTVTLSATVKPDNAENKGVTWSISSGSSYASISSDGVLTAKAAGKVTVKATAKDGSGVSATYTVTVKAGAMWEGEGTKSNPFLIKNLTDLKNLQKVVDKKGYYFLQVADIDCSSVETWIVIGTEEKPFRHHYDGGGYTIKNLHFAGESGGLITVAEDTTFRDIHIENATAKDVQTSLGSIVGYGTNCSFYDCSAKVEFSGSNPNVGGIVGYVVLNENQTVLMENCHAEGIIHGGAYAGGLIGQIYKYYENNETPEEPKAAVTDCYANVEISVPGGAGDGANAGGLIGCSHGVKIHHCHATGNVTAKFEYMGGLVGQSGYACEIAYCYATGDVTCTSDDQYGGAFAGGLVGYMFSDTHVHDCYATGDISAPDVGWSNCQDKPSMDGGPWLNYRNPCGSLIGCIHVIGQSYKMELYNCYATGTVYAPKICEDDRVYCHGAVVGCIYDHVTRRNVIDKSKYDQTDWAGFSEVSFTRLESCFNVEALRTYFRPITEFTRSSQRKYEMPVHEYVTIVTEEQLTDQSVFEGWDFENVWIMGENGPELR